MIGFVVLWDRMIFVGQMWPYKFEVGVIKCLSFCPWKERVSQKASACHLSAHWFREWELFGSLLLHTSQWHCRQNSNIRLQGVHCFQVQSTHTGTLYIQFVNQAPYSPVSVLIRKEIVMNMVNIPILDCIRTFHASIIYEYIIIGSHVVWNWDVLPLVAYPRVSTS